MLGAFKEGTLLTGNLSSRRYTFTNDRALLYVDRCLENDINVKIIAHTDSYSVGSVCCVDPKCFYEIKAKDYFQKYPNAKTIDDFDQYVCANDDKSEAAIEPHVKFELSDQQRDELFEEMRDLLNTYGYRPTREGCNKIIDTWAENKGDLIRMISKHPNYNGKFQIVFDSDFDREIDPNESYSFFDYVDIWVNQNREKFFHKKHMGPFTYGESIAIRDKLYAILSSLRNIKANDGIISQEYYESCRADYFKFEHICEQLKNSIGEDYQLYQGEIYTKESARKYNGFMEVIYILKIYHSQYLDETIVEELNSKLPELKAIIGQKTSRIVNKFCKMLGIDKDFEYQKRFALYADSINPLKVRRHTVISCHPIDYFTMSFGNSWASCQTIDKHNYRGMDNYYSGCYSGGTLSYMLDGTSVVFYTVDKSYSGNSFELEPKITRNMFHIGEDKIIQGRVYPQSSDDSNSIYLDIREIVQKVVADCMGKPNLWTMKEGISECVSVIDTEGVHYKDYTEFNNCNVSYLKNTENKRNIRKIVVGHESICPRCGIEHLNEDVIECEDCYIS